MKKVDSTGLNLSKIKILFVCLCFIGTSCNLHNNEDQVKDDEIPTPEVVLNLPPSENNPRNSEGDFITLRNGKLLYVYTHYYNGFGLDHDPAFLASRFSLDRGKTWTDKSEIILKNDGTQNIMSVSLLRLKNGDIALFYLRKNDLDDCIPIMRTSNNEGITWGEPIECISSEGYFVLNNDRVIQLKGGRLMFAVAKHSSKDGIFNPQGDLYCYYSDNSGKTWSSSKKVPNNTKIITQEPGLIEMADGRIMMFIRANNGKQQLSYSNDGGNTWSHIEQSNISSPLSPASIEKIPNSNDWIMVWNNNNGSIADIKEKRTPLTVAISKNEGKSWKNLKNIETQKEGWFCYTAIEFIGENEILLGYCAGNKKTGIGLSDTRLKKVDKRWINQ